jgi:hypothetical protein
MRHYTKTAEARHSKQETVTIAFAPTILFFAHRDHDRRTVALSLGKIVAADLAFAQLTLL